MDYVNRIQSTCEEILKDANVDNHQAHSLCENMVKDTTQNMNIKEAKPLLKETYYLMKDLHDNEKKLGQVANKDLDNMKNNQTSISEDRFKKLMLDVGNVMAQDPKFMSQPPFGNVMLHHKQLNQAVDNMGKQLHLIRPGGTPELMKQVEQSRKKLNQTLKQDAEHYHVATHGI